MSGPVVQADAEVASAVALAEKLLRAGGHRGRWVPVAAVAMGRALVRTTPGSEHGKVLAAALRAPRLGDPGGVGAVLRLARSGITPTQAAVASCLEQQEGHIRRLAAVRALARDLAGAEVEGPRAAAWVAGVLAETGTGPTWGELAAAMGWPRPVAGVQIRALIAGGWLTASSRPRSLRPGPSFPVSLSVTEVVCTASSVFACACRGLRTSGVSVLMCTDRRLARTPLRDRTTQSSAITR